MKGIVEAGIKEMDFIFARIFQASVFAIVLHSFLLNFSFDIVNTSIY